MLIPGTYEATIVDYGIQIKEGKAPSAMIKFSFMDDMNTPQTINWFGSFNATINPGKTMCAADITCAALAACGWTTNNPSNLAKGAGSGVLNEKMPVSITIANEEYNGKTTMKVKFINPVGGAGFREKITEADAVKAFAGMNLSGIAAKAREKYKKPIPNMAPKKVNGMDDDEIIPF